MADEQEILNRWRLVLGKYSAGQISFSSGEINYMDMENVLDYLYSREYGEEQEVRKDRTGGSDGSRLTVPYWLRQIKRLFPKRTVEILERHALEKYGMTELVTDPEVLMFTEDELVLAEDYLLGNVEQQELEKLAFRDMSKVPNDKAQSCEAVLNQMMTRGGGEEARRLAQFLFAAGQSTCASLLMPESQYFSFNYREFFPSEPEKRVAVYAPVIARGMRLRGRSTIPDLIKKADGNPENIRKALAYQKKSLSGRLVLLGAYFVAKYPDVEQTGVLLEKQDARLMKEYEDDIVGNLSQIYLDQAVLANWKEIKDAINNDKVDSNILKLAETGYNVNQYKLQIFGGMSYMNYPLSTRLKNVVKICLRSNLDVMQNIMTCLDMRNDRVKRAGDDDEIFGIEPPVYIEWAAKRKEYAVLNVQCRRNRECFLEYMAKADFEIYNIMASILKRIDPEEYQARIKTGASRQQAKVIDTFVNLMEGNVSGDVRAYLQGLLLSGTGWSESL